MVPRLVVLQRLEVGGSILPHSPVVVFVFVAAAAALNCSQTLRVEFSGSGSAVGRLLVQAVRLLRIQ